MKDISVGAAAPPFDPNLQHGFCTCRSGRDHDGAEFGLCEFCERSMDEDARARAIARDAARWRLSQARGFFRTSGDRGFHVGIQPHPVTSATPLNQCCMGRGESLAAAIDGMFASLASYNRDGFALPRNILDALALFEDAQP